MASKDSVRIKAEEFFIENPEVTQADVASIYKVRPGTISTWAKKYNWEDKRLDYHASPVKIKQLLQKELVNVAGGNKPTMKADDISKLMAALDRCDKKADPIVVHKILKDLDNYIAEINPLFAQEATHYHKLFLQHRINLES